MAFSYLTIFIMLLFSHGDRCHIIGFRSLYQYKSSSFLSLWNIRNNPVHPIMVVGSFCDVLFVDIPIYLGQHNTRPTSVLINKSEEGIFYSWYITNKMRVEHTGGGGTHRSFFRRLKAKAQTAFMASKFDEPNRLQLASYNSAVRRRSFERARLVQNAVSIASVYIDCTWRFSF